MQKHQLLCLFAPGRDRDQVTEFLDRFTTQDGSEIRFTPPGQTGEIRRRLESLYNQLLGKLPQGAKFLSAKHFGAVLSGKDVQTPNTDRLGGLVNTGRCYAPTGRTGPYRRGAL